MTAAAIGPGLSEISQGILGMRSICFFQELGCSDLLAEETLRKIPRPDYTIEDMQ